MFDNISIGMCITTFFTGLLASVFAGTLWMGVIIGLGCGVCWALGKNDL